MTTDNTASTLQATIFNIDRFATHDGPGIRTNIYFKGCPLRCQWCSNPEGQSGMLELSFNETKCNSCNLCLEVCNQAAIKHENDKLTLNRGKCNLCQQCISVCPTGALSVYGKTYSLPALMELIEKDRHIFRKSGGGITCTGGEALMQSVFLLSFLKECHESGIHTAVETSGYADEQIFKTALEYIDWLFFDLKHLDNSRHKELTGRDDVVIQNNLHTASSMLGNKGKTLVIRQVLVPGLNDGRNILHLINLANTLPHLNMIELLPYHAYGKHKYGNLGRIYLLDELDSPKEGILAEYKQLIENHGIKCLIGTV